MQRLAHLLTLVMAIALFATAGFAQDGKLKIKVTPKQAYVFVDGNAVRDGSQSISLSPGKHTVVVVNYGYKISTQDVTIEAGKSTPLEVKLDAQGGNVGGPFGDLLLEGDSRAAVLSGGTAPGYFVGHVDEMNNDWVWHQNLLLPPGSHHITVTHAGKTVWSGDVTIEANKKTVIYMDKKQDQDGRMEARREFEGRAAIQGGHCQRADCRGAGDRQLQLLDHPDQLRTVLDADLEHDGDRRQQYQRHRHRAEQRQPVGLTACDHDV